MSLTRRVAHNTIIQTIGKAISTMLGILVVALMTRYLGQQGFGQYSTIIAFLQIFGILVDFGLTLITVQMISEPGADEQKIIRNIFTLRFFSAAIFLGLAPIVVLFTPYPAIIKIGVLVTTLHFFFIALNQVLIGLFQKKLRIDRVAIAEIVGRLILLGAIWSIIYFEQGLLWIMGAVVLSSLANFLTNFIFSLKYVRIKFSFDWSLWRKIISRAWPIGISIAFNLIYLRADILILSLLHSDSAVGLYSAAYRVIDIIIVLPMMFIGLILPALTYHWASQNHDQFKKVLQKAFDFLTILSLPLVVGTWFIGRPIMTLIAGEQFALSGDILKILIIAGGIIFVGSLFGHTIIALNKQRQVIWAYLATALVTLIGYFIFIPRYSYWGAAGMTVFSEIMIAIITFILVYRYTKILPSLKIVGKAIIACLIMACLLYWIKGFNLFLTIILATIVYFGTLYLVRGISKDTILEIVKLRNKN